ncbi:hybrid sensor histidine kinase/response regulator transcription factor [Pedobacter jeongneungensis]|uniref:hybrid sensor histidine kinase/response regulator transcription factor n=1 Tax=Pedobacter jeongneungensis TaxID=947309 RepID=UPI000A058829|nr:hybrid sensor histidine kinase/response regulator transcription factor [Pedobacter jeongneungensis]
MMKPRFSAIGFCLLLLICTSLYAQKPIVFNHLTMENGLSQNSVMAIAQDKNQLIWMGTRHGLNRYDGYRFKIYNSSSDNQNSISDNVITTLLSDSKGRLWVGTENGLNLYNEKSDRFIRINKKSSSKSFSCDSVECVYEDPQQNIWIGTYNGLNLVVNAEKQVFKKFLFDKPDHKTGINLIFSVFKDDRQNLWVGTFNGLVRIYQVKGKYHFEIFRHRANDAKSISSNAVKSIIIDKQKRLWLGTYSGLNLFDYQHKTFTRYQTSATDANSIVNNDIRKLTCDKTGNIWIGTQEGLSIFDPNTRKFSNYRYDPEQGSGLSQNSIHSIFQDLNGSMYVGTFYKGVNVVYPSATPFTVYRNSKKQQGLSSNIVSAMAEDQYHNLWIGTEGGGLNYVNRSKNTFTYYRSEPNNSNGLNSNLIKTLCLDKTGQLLVGTHRGGLYVFNPSAQNFRKIINVKDVKNSPGGAEVIAITEDSNGMVWVGSRDGLSTLSKTNGVYAGTTVKSILEKSIRNKYIQVIFEDQAKNLWIGTRAGLYAYNPTLKRITAYYQNKANTKGLKSDYINCIMQLKNGNIGIGTALGGLSIFDYKSRKFKNYNEKDGLPNSNVFGIIEDEEKNLWISTDKGLSKLVTSTGKFINYTKSDGLAGNNFNINSFLKDSHSKFFFGGYDGLTAFYPKQIDINKNVAPITFTGLKLFNQPVEVNGGDGILKKAIQNTPQITFKHDENNFSIDFALLNYIKPEKNSYSYMLKGHSKAWTKTDVPSVSYADLPSGNYTFMVTGNNNDGNPGGKAASLNIIILPPFWATWWAYFIYLAFFSGLLFLIVRYLFVRALLKRTEDMQKMKLNFFTYVAHEIRTPLTLILGPLENLSNQYQTDTELNRQLIPIKNNANRLMRLITELMDFRKAETGHLTLHVTEDNIIEFINEIFISFSHLAQANGIQYEFIHGQENINLFFDKRQLEKVLFNLLSNAFKFCDKGGKISVSVLELDDDVTISISDNGLGIPAESLRGLFSDYFQVDEQQSHIGSGIGLALSKAIVEEHQGSIAVESTPAKNGSRGFTKFTVKLKKGKSHLKTALFDGVKDYPAHPDLYTQQAEETITVINPEKEMDPAAETILVVEDNSEIRSLITSLVGNNYQIAESENGLLGWETAVEMLPDLIICDIMMPVMDGIELCRRLKQDERTSHIPVIILTARSSHIHQVSGLETGADAYITKPFSPELLLLNVRNLLMSRQVMRQKFLKHIHLQPKELTINAVDEAFMQKLLGYIDQHIADEDFGVSELASMIGMSKPVLYKKIRQLTNLSVNDFVKSIRLKKAMELFKQNRFTIYEVAYQVGFNDPKYFSREFKKQFGKNPRAFMNGEE